MNCIIEPESPSMEWLEAADEVWVFGESIGLMSYPIGSYTIDRNGNLLVEPENADAELLTTLLNEGLIRGGESIESTDDQMENTEPTDHLEEDPVTEDTEAETEVLDEQESEDESTTEGNEPAEAESEEASEPDNAAEDEPDAEEPESEEQSEAEDQPEEVPLDLELAFPVSQHNGVTLRNLVNLLYSRGKLIGKATGGHFHVEEGLVEKLKDDSCTFAIMNFINAVSDYEAEHGAALEPQRITAPKRYTPRKGAVPRIRCVLYKVVEMGNYLLFIRKSFSFGKMIF